MTADDQPSTPPPAKGEPKHEGIGTIFEQILVAFILAFVFRAFVLEAFVIPTGSMATTLLGAHMALDCPDCGWDFTLNYPSDSATGAVPPTAQVAVPDRAGRTAVFDRVYAVRCPNCAYRLPRLDPADPDNDATAPAVSYGDRILVLKHLYLLSDPQRYDVVVFKTPSRARDPRNGADLHAPWSTEPYQQNYIKRLVGLPGDTLMLVSGDVFVTRQQKTLAELSPDDFEIARKGEVAQGALWRVVYDDDHRPQGLPRDAYEDRAGLVTTRDPAFVLPWRPDGQGWRAVPQTEGGGFAFDSREVGTLRFDAESNYGALPLSDLLAYDVTGSDQRYNDAETVLDIVDTFDRDFVPKFARPNGPLRFYDVSDLKLSLFYQRTGGTGGGEGPLTLRLTKRGDAFEADLRPGRATLTRVKGDGTRVVIGDIAIDQDFDEPAQVELVNADYRVTLRVGGEAVIQTTDADYAPDVAELLRAEEDDEPEPTPTAEIAAADHSALVRHVGLWRDIYYTARDQRGRLDSYRRPYASPEDFPDNVIRLGEDEYFTLGDNPFLSGDARIWTDGLTLPYEGGLSVEGGRVPGRFLLGRAFFVYWPASYPIADFLPKRLRVAPNFGDMRFIR